MKILKSIYIFSLLVLLSTLLFVIVPFPSLIKLKMYDSYSGLDSSYILIDSYDYKFDFIRSEKVTTTHYAFDYAKIVNETIYMDTSNIKAIPGTIFKIGDQIGNFTFPYLGRLLRINNDNILIENLNETTLITQYRLYLSPPSVEDFAFQVNYMFKTIGIYSIITSYDSNSSFYNFKIYINNSDGFIINNASCNIFIKRTINYPGLMVLTDTIQKDGEHQYLRKVTVIKNKTYYQQIDIRVLEQIDNYSVIEGNIKAGNKVYYE